MSVAEKQIAFDSNGRRLVGRLFAVEGTPYAARAPGILFIHGFGSDMRGYRPRAEAASAVLGAVCLTFDLGGHGKSTGDRDALSERDYRLDVLAAYDELVAVSGVDPERIGVCGASYGGFLAAMLVTERRVARLLLRAPAFGDHMDQAPSTLTTYSGPVLIVESGEDEVVSRTTIDAYVSACAGRAQRFVINGASHALTEPGWQRAFVDMIVEWFREL